MSNESQRHTSSQSSSHRENVNRSCSSGRGRERKREREWEREGERESTWSTPEKHSRFPVQTYVGARGPRIDRADWCNLACARVRSVLRTSGRWTRHQSQLESRRLWTRCLAVCQRQCAFPCPIPTRLLATATTYLFLLRRRRRRSRSSASA